MARPGRVAWSEGMGLDPHHFQQWDRYHSSLVHARLRALSPHGWGLTELELDEDAIPNGIVRIARCSGVMADGLCFSIPDTDRPPAPRAVATHFPPTDDRLVVYLATPSERDSGTNFLLPNATSHRETRFVVESVAVIDETTGQDERTIEIARPNLVLLFEGERMDGYTALPIAQLVRTPSGGIQLSDQFVPPALAIGASKALRTIVRRLLERLVSKNAGLWQRTRHVSRGQAPLSAADALGLWIELTVSTFIPVLRHYESLGTSHPEAVYMTLVTLAGQLVALPTNRDLDHRALPAYNHEHLGPCFADLHGLISRLLEGDVDPNYIAIPLVRRDDVYVGQIEDGTLLDQATFFLIATDVAAGTERTIPDQLRVASPATMSTIRQSFLKALPLEWEPRPPVGAPSGPELQFYRLGKSGPYWDEIRAGGAVAVYAPARLDALRLQLIAIRQRA